MTLANNYAGTPTAISRQDCCTNRTRQTGQERSKLPPQLQRGLGRGQFRRTNLLPLQLSHCSGTFRLATLSCTHMPRRLCRKQGNWLYRYNCRSQKKESHIWGRPECSGQCGVLVIKQISKRCRSPVFHACLLKFIVFSKQYALLRRPQHLVHEPGPSPEATIT